MAGIGTGIMNFIPINAPVNLSESILEITFNAADKIKIAVENASIIVPALANCITPFPPGMFSNVNLILANVKNTLISYQAALKADVLMKIAKAVAVLAGSLFG